MDTYIKVVPMNKFEKYVSIQTQSSKKLIKTAKLGGIIKRTYFGAS